MRRYCKTRASYGCSRCFQATMRVLQSVQDGATIGGRGCYKGIAVCYHHPEAELQRCAVGASIDVVWCYNCARQELRKCVADAAKLYC
jgi:hypothetical protein